MPKENARESSLLVARVLKNTEDRIRRGRERSCSGKAACLIIFPVFVFAIDNRIQGDAFNLADGLKHVQDWASICFSPQFAKSHALTA